jgi:archaemetzincin
MGLIIVYRLLLIAGLLMITTKTNLGQPNLNEHAAKVNDVKAEIVLIPIGKVPADVSSWLADALPQIFNCTCRIAPALPHPTFAWNKRRQQYSAEAILSHVQRGNTLCALGIADLDLFVPDLNFVFGLASSNEGRAIIALPRLRQSYYGLQENAELFRERVVKEAVHELGHVFGLAHCSDRRCVMAFSNSLRDTDYKGREFCQRCRKALLGH